MANQPSTKAIFAAVAASSALAAAKFIAGAAAGSAAVIAEGVHSTVDVGNSLLLYLGLRRSVRPRDAAHPFGYGKEVYFWTLIVSLVIVVIGGCVTILEGVWHLLNEQRGGSHLASYLVLALAGFFNGYSWVVSWRAFRQTKGRRGWWEAARTAKDPTLVVIFVEDCASLLGVVIAFLGVFLGQVLYMPALDGVASLLIGLLMGVVGVWLAHEARGLLLGESADGELVKNIRRVVEADQAVELVGDPRTMQLGPEEVLLNLEIKFGRGMTVEKMESAIVRLESEIREQFPEVKQIFLAADSLASGRFANQ